MMCWHVLLTCKWGLPSFLLAGFSCRNSKRDGSLHQHLISNQPGREKGRSFKHMKLRVNMEAAEHTATKTIMKITLTSGFDE